MLAAACGGLLAAGWRMHAEYTRFMQPGGRGAWIAFWALAVSAVLAFARVRRAPFGERILLCAVGLVCVVLAGDAISWGQRVLGYLPPRAFLDRGLQDVGLRAWLAPIVSPRWLTSALALAYGVALPLFAWQQWLPPGIAPHRGLVPWFAAVAGIELLYPFQYAGGAADLLLALALLADASLRERPAAHFAVAAQCAALIAGAISPVLQERALARGNAVAVQAAREELKEIAEDLKGPPALRGPLFYKTFIHKQILSAVRARYVAFGKDSRYLGDGTDERRRWFLDPWNNPYWLLYQSNGTFWGRLLIYSFGPNGRRDSLLESIPRKGDEVPVSGDDVGVILTVADWSRR